MTAAYSTGSLTAHVGWLGMTVGSRSVVGSRCYSTFTRWTGSRNDFDWWQHHRPDY